METHFLLRPRVVALVALAAFGVEGLGLMGVSIAFVVGLGISVFACVGGIALYWGDYVDAWKRRSVKEKSVAELALPVLLVCALGFAGFHYASESPSKISFQKFAFFYVKNGEDAYQIGMVAKFFNEGDRSYLAHILRFDTGSATIAGRGGWLLQELIVFPVQLNIKIDNYVKANDVTYFKELLPIFFHMQPAPGITEDIDPTPEFILTGQWSLILDANVAKLSPLGYATSPSIVSQQQWNDLQKPGSKINIEDLDYKPFQTTTPSH
jgi:hypothetical protein